MYAINQIIFLLLNNRHVGAVKLGRVVLGSESHLSLSLMIIYLFINRLNRIEAHHSLLQCAKQQDKK